MPPFFSIAPENASTNQRLFSTLLELFTGQEYESGDADVTSYTPTEDTWEEGDRAVWCAAYVGETQWTGSLSAN